MTDETKKNKPPKTPRKMGRPAKYTPELALLVCELLASGKSLRTVCKDPRVPDIKTIFKWIGSNPEFFRQYEKAKQESTEALVEEILDIADDGTNDWMEENDPDNPGYKANREHIQRSRLRVDARKWIVAKLKPKKYGDSLHVGGTIDVRHSLADRLAQAEKRIEQAAESFPEIEQVGGSGEDEK